MRVPFDSLCLAAVVAEAREWVGARIQRSFQPDDSTIVIEFYAGRERWLLISADAQFARAHFVSKRPAATGVPPAFGAALRKELDGGRLVGVRQRGFDRVLDLDFSSARGDMRLVAELMGKHANAMLVRADGRLAGALKWVGPNKSRRPVLPGAPYEPPPFPERRSLLDAALDDDLSELEGASPFLLRWLEAAGEGALARVREAVRIGRFEPTFAPGAGAYPLSLAVLGVDAEPAETYSKAAERHFAEAEHVRRLESLRSRLAGQLERVLLARDVALSDLREASDAAARAHELQERGNLILAYASSLPEGASELRAPGYDGGEVAVPLDPTATPVENAERLFAKAKKAKSGAAQAEEQTRRLEVDRQEIAATLDHAREATTLAALQSLGAEADRRRWLHRQPDPARRPEERPYEGKPIRELLAPGGWRVLYGDSAEANDYLTLRVAKPDDWWLHVRSEVGAHVIVPTDRRPERVPPDVLQFAAQIAARQSAAKHARYVEVACTLRRYVRRVRGGKPGAVVYTHEKTLVVEP